MRPLDGYRVVELGMWVAAPAAAALLGDWGADVVKVESPGGDPNRYTLKHVGQDVEGSPPFETDNRAKRGVVLDLRTDDTLDVLGLDDQINASREPSVWATAQALGDLFWEAHHRPRRPPPSIVYRSRTTPQHNSNIALFEHSASIVSANRLRDTPGLLEAAITADGFSIDLN